MKREFLQVQRGDSLTVTAAGDARPGVGCPRRGDGVVGVGGDGGFHGQKRAEISEVVGSR